LRDISKSSLLIRKVLIAVGLAAQWYTVPPEHADRFEQIAHGLFPQHVCISIAACLIMRRPLVTPYVSSIDERDCGTVSSLSGVLATQDGHDRAFRAREAFHSGLQMHSG